MAKVIDLTGQTFGRLTVLAQAPIACENGIHAKWICKCSCSNFSIVRSNNLRKGVSQSCGCLNRETILKHGYSRAHKSSEHNSYWSMMTRCYNPKGHAWLKYGGANPPVTVCDRWRYGEDGLTGLECFVADMGQRPKGTTLDRWPNGKGSYCKANCRWATPKQQTNNRRTTKMIEVNGEQMTFSDAASKYGIKYTTLRKRLKNGLSVMDALIKPTKLTTIKRKNGVPKDAALKTRDKSDFIEASDTIAHPGEAFGQVSVQHLELAAAFGVAERDFSLPVHGGLDCP